MKTKTDLTYNQMIEGLRNKVTECRIEIEALKEEKQTAMFDFGIDGQEYDEWIEEQHEEIRRLHKMIIQLQAIYREVR